MSWIEKRNSLKMLSSHSPYSSNLKRKQSLINRLKNISIEKIDVLKDELENENFNKFHTEIINNLLLNINNNSSSEMNRTIQKTIQKITEIIYLFYFDNSFVNYLLSTLKKEFKKNKKWQIGCLIAEVCLLNTTVKNKKESINGRLDVSNKNTLQLAISNILSSLESDKIQFILYCCKYFEIDKKSIFEESIREEIKKANNENIEMINEVIDIVGLGEKVTVFEDYVEIIKPIEGEFDFYNISGIIVNNDKNNNGLTVINNDKNNNGLTVINNDKNNNGLTVINNDKNNNGLTVINNDKNNNGLTSKSIINNEDIINIINNSTNTSVVNHCLNLETCNTLIKNIEKKELPPCLLDLIGHSIYDSPDIIKKLIKKKKHADFIPNLARILSKSIKNRKIYTDSILNCINNENDILLICECFKFGIFTNEEFFSIFDKINKIDLICVILSNVGRFILYKKDTNKKAIEIIERIKGNIKEDVGRIQFNNCLANILNPVSCKIDIIDFLRYYFKSIESESIIKLISTSKRFILMLLSQPSLFPNKENLINFIKILNIQIPEINSFYLKCIKKIYNKHKSLSIELLNTMIYINNSYDEQVQIIDAILEMKINEEWKMTALIKLLDGFDKNLHDKYIGVIRKRCKNFNEFFNFCEKYKYKIEIEEDSFEREMKDMEEYSE